MGAWIELEGVQANDDVPGVLEGGDRGVELGATKGAKGAHDVAPEVYEEGVGHVFIVPQAGRWGRMVRCPHVK